MCSDQVHEFGGHLPGIGLAVEKFHRAQGDAPREETSHDRDVGWLQALPIPDLHLPPIGGQSRGKRESERHERP